jgi:hypothetical protein
MVKREGGPVAWEREMWVGLEWWILLGEGKWIFKLFHGIDLEGF